MKQLLFYSNAHLLSFARAIPDRDLGDHDSNPESATNCTMNLKKLLFFPSQSNCHLLLSEDDNSSSLLFFSVLTASFSQKGQSPTTFEEHFISGPLACVDGNDIFSHIYHHQIQLQYCNPGEKKKGHEL